RRVADGARETELVIHRVGAPGIRFPEGQVLLDDVEVDRQITVLEAVVAEHRIEAAVEAGSTRIPVHDTAEIEREGAEGRAETDGAVDLGGGPVRERDAGSRDTGVELEVRAHIVPRLEVDVARRIVVGLSDAAENVVARDAGAEGDVPRIRWCRRR